MFVNRSTIDAEGYQAMLAQQTAYSPLAPPRTIDRRTLDPSEYSNRETLNAALQAQAAFDWRGHENASSLPAGASLPPINERARSNEAFLYTTVDPALANLRGSQRRSRTAVSPKAGSDTPQPGGTVDPNAKVRSLVSKPCRRSRLLSPPSAPGGCDFVSRSAR